MNVKKRILSVFLTCCIVSCATISPFFAAQSQAAEITLASGKAINAKVILTAALAAGGLIAMGEAQGAVTAAQKAEIRTKVGQLEDAYIAQQLKQADTQVQTATYIKDGVTHYVPIVKAAITDAVSSAGKKISYVSKEFLSSWYDFLSSSGFLSVQAPTVGGSSLDYSGSYSDSFSKIDGAWPLCTCVVYDASGKILASYSNSSADRRNGMPGYGFFLSGTRTFGFSPGWGQVFGYVNVPVGGSVSITSGYPIFADQNTAKSWAQAMYNGASFSGDILNSGSGAPVAQSSYYFGLTSNLPVASGSTYWPKTWVGGEVSDLPVSGVTITDTPDLPDLTIPDLGQDVIGTAVPIDLGADIPDLWTEGGEVSADVIDGTGVGAGDLPWELPTTGDLPFPIPGVAFPGTIPAEDTWPDIQDKVQEGEFDGSIDVPLPGVTDAWPSVDNAPTDEQVETAADAAIDWSIGSITLPDGLFDKIPFCIPYDLYLLATSVLYTDASSGGQVDPSGVFVSSDAVQVDFSSSAVSWRSAPHIRGTVHLPLGVGLDVPIDIDCSQYDYFAALVWYGIAFVWTALILVSLSRSFGRM